MARGLYPPHDLEYLDGEASLGPVRGAGADSGTLEIMRQGGSASMPRHRSMVVHRGFQPDNYLFVPTDSGGVVSVEQGVDSGSPRFADRRRLQTRSRPFGNPQYMSPEQAYGKNQDIDQRTDCVGVGGRTIVVEMVTGHRLFSGVHWRRSS